MKFYFTLQAKLFYRTIKDLEIHPLLAVLAVLGFFVGGSYVLFSKIGYAQYWYAGIGLFLTYLLGGKERNEFLKNLFTKDKYRLMRFCENMLVALPFILFLLFEGFFIVPACFIVLSTALSFYNNVGQSFFTIPTPFYKWPFEFTTGFRRNFWGFVVIYLLEIGAISAGNFNLGMFVMLTCFVLCQYFYFKIEPHFFVWVHAQTARDFVRNKMKIATIYSLITAFPLAILLTIYNPGYAHWVALGLVVGVVYCLVGAVAKYAYYPDELPIFHQTIIGVGLLVPPFSLILIPYFYALSIKSLKTHLK
jgi:hypothetical protein